MKKTLLMLCFGLISYISNAQLFTGGNVGINYDQGVYIDVAPEIGYMFFEKLRIGVSPFYSYVKANGAPSSEYTYGGRTFARLEIFGGVYLSANAEAINVKNVDSRKWIYSLPLGAGFQYKVGVINTYAEVLYDVILDDSNPRKNPIVRGGVNYDF